MATYTITGDDYDTLIGLLDGITYTITLIQASISSSDTSGESSKEFFVTFEADLTPEQIAALPILG